uniref:Uncharacterized protein n=1 Tax=uncultured Desulfobacterium sp. TaxID=201089 RepID=E1Y990_9BACT|nr:unknown protein [uncultured Desulfobacterium sp.]
MCSAAQFNKTGGKERKAVLKEEYETRKSKEGNHAENVVS